MMFGSALLIQVLLATAAFAIPTSKERLAERVARRAARSHLTQPKQLVVHPVSEEQATGNTTHAEFSSNWSGAVLVAGAVSTLVNIYTSCASSGARRLTYAYLSLEHLQICDGYLHDPHAA